ncbi:hypothetical protein [Paludisphaera sp.]|uniref:hypothetical protein n=1 Tax=Paludisphaera sp. TaxID=2017432 RepID=UPI00301D35DC
MANWTTFAPPPIRPAGAPRSQGDRAPIPFGAYRCRLADVRLTASRLGHPTAKLTFKVVAGPHAGRAVFRDVWLTDAARAHADREAVALGYENAAAMTTAPPPLDRLFDVRVALAASRAGGWHNVVEHFAAVADAPAAETCPEATDDAPADSNYEYQYPGTPTGRHGPTDDADEIARARLIAAELLGGPPPADAPPEADHEAEAAPPDGPTPAPEPPAAGPGPASPALASLTALERIWAERERVAREAATAPPAAAPPADDDRFDMFGNEYAPAPGPAGDAA